MKRCVGEFSARDGRGNRHELEMWREFIGPGVWGGSELRTAKGELVNQREDGDYEMASSGVILRPEGPRASHAAPTRD
jgi:hypothetical protein